MKHWLRPEEYWESIIIWNLLLKNTFRSSECPRIGRYQHPHQFWIKKEEVLIEPTYKECLMKGMDPLDGKYID
jgi:hypothetical protein